MSFNLFTCPQGARTPDWPPHTNPGLQPHTPPVKNNLGGTPTSLKSLLLFSDCSDYNDYDDHDCHGGYDNYDNSDDHNTPN